jgi:hypothetical protein
MAIIQPGGSGGSGVVLPVSIANGGTGKTTAAAAFNALSPLTTAGDLIYENATPAAARLALGTSGQVVGVGSSIPAWLYPPGYELNYTQITSNANITDTSESTATALISPGAITFDGTPVMVEFFTSLLSVPTAAAGNESIVTLFEGSTQITRLAYARDTLTANANQQTVLAHYRFTPSSGSHTYKICGFVSSTTGTPTITASSGGTGGNPPAFVRFTKV